MEQEQIEQTTIPALTSIDLPVAPMRAALACTSDEKTRYYLGGVFVHAVEGSTRIAATDGHRLFVFSVPTETEAPDWLKAGITVPKEGLKERLAMIEKLDSSTARIAYQSEAPQVVISDPGNHCTFRMAPVDGTFPDYQRILDSVRVFEGREISDMASIAYNGKYLKSVGDIAKQLGSDAVRLFGASLATEPSLVTFPNAPGAVLVLMPMRHDAALAGETVKVISGAVNSTVSALRAHQTRWTQKVESAPNKKARQEALAKVAEYETRISAIMANTSPPALPAPEPQPETSEPATASETGEPTETPPGIEPVVSGPSPAVPETVSSDIPPPSAEMLAASRAKLGNGLRKKSMRRFMADINAVLSRDHDGLTINQLADGVPILSWFEAGLTAHEAAERCKDWRRVETVLPPDEVAPGEGGEPCGHLTVTEQEHLEAAD